MTTWRHAKASIFRLELLDLSFKEKMMPAGGQQVTHSRPPPHTPQVALTWYEHGDVLRERARQHVDQLRQHVEAALACFHALLLQLLVQSFHDDGDLQRASGTMGERERLTDAQWPESELRRRVGRVGGQPRHGLPGSAAW